MRLSDCERFQLVRNVRVGGGARPQITAMRAHWPPSAAPSAALSIAPCRLQQHLQPPSAVPSRPQSPSAAFSRTLNRLISRFQPPSAAFSSTFSRSQPSPVAFSCLQPHLQPPYQPISTAFSRVQPLQPPELNPA